MRLILLTAALALGATMPATGDELLVDKVRASGTSGVEIPRGRTMERVRTNRGEPETVKGPVGEPPITRWVYDDYTVYFEHDRVIHSVMRR